MATKGKSNKSTRLTDESTERQSAHSSQSKKARTTDKSKTASNSVNKIENKSTAHKVIIVESPAKARTIENILGSEYQVVSSKGHVRDLPKSNLVSI